MSNLPFSKTQKNANGKQAQLEQTEDWNGPDLGDIPNAPLTKINREKIKIRDREIAEK